MATEQIAAAERLALHAAAFNGMPDPVLHLAARAMGVVTGLAALEPDPPGDFCGWPFISQSYPSVEAWLFDNERHGYGFVSRALAVSLGLYEGRSWGPER